MVHALSAPWPDQHVQVDRHLSLYPAYYFKMVLYLRNDSEAKIFHKIKKKGESDDLQLTSGIAAGWRGCAPLIGPSILVLP